jgi:hypothetical protein
MLRRDLVLRAAVAAKEGLRNWRGSVLGPCCTSNVAGTGEHAADGARLPCSAPRGQLVTPPPRPPADHAHGAASEASTSQPSTSAAMTVHRVRTRSDIAHTGLKRSALHVLLCSRDCTGWGGGSNVPCPLGARSARLTAPAGLPDHQQGRLGRPLAPANPSQAAIAGGGAGAARQWRAGARCEQGGQGACCSHTSPASSAAPLATSVRGVQ